MTTRKKWNRDLLLKHAGHWTWALLRALLMAGISFILLYPLLEKVCRSFMEIQDIYDVTVQYFPKHFTWKNYQMIAIWMDMPKTLWNTLLLSVTTGVCQTISATVVSYGFARYRVRGSKLLFAMVLVGLVVPPDIVLAPLYLNFTFFDPLGLIHLVTGASGINIADGFAPFLLLGLTSTGLKSGLYVFLMRQYFLGMPRELEEAAWVDGANPFRTFLQIMLPGALPMMATVFLFSFVWQWLDGMFTTAFLTDTKVMVTALNSLTHVGDLAAQGVSDPLEISLARYAGIVLLILPPLIVYIFCQKSFVQSIERSGLVG